ncbi:hypothetical protein FKM82_024529, partial [Ascaphus truei]
MVAPRACLPDVACGRYLCCCSHSRFCFSIGGTAFMHIKATDLDDPATANGDLRYKIISHSPTGSEHTLQVEPRTGAVSLTEAGVSMLLQLEVSKFKLGVHVKDMGDDPLGYIALANLEVEAVENTWMSPSPVFLQENLKGTYPRIISEVKWRSTEVHYHLEGDCDTELCRVDETGNIYITKELDRETQAEYRIAVLAVNDDGVAYSDPLEIRITVIDENDNKPVFSQDAYYVNITERTKGTQLLKLKATDADEEDTLNTQISYKIRRQEPQLSNDLLFHIEEETGVVTLQDSSLKAGSAKRYVLEVSATDLAGDRDGLSSTCTVIIEVVDLNDSPPVFLKNQFTPFIILEDTEAGAFITTLTATDEDEQLDNKVIEFYVQSGNEDGAFGIRTDQENSTVSIFLEK